MTLVDVDGDGDLDLVSTGPSGVRLYRNARGVFTEAAGLLGGQTDGGGVPMPPWPRTTTTTAGPICSCFAPEATGSCTSALTGGSMT